jgi:argininosuccinate lyase
MKLWQKDNYSVDQMVEQFTVGRDKEFDLLLAKYDVQGSIAHVTMLGEVGLMTKEEANIAVKALEAIAVEIAEGTFEMSDEVEDIHSMVEYLLTQRIGDIGKKIHSGRSRNDQVLVDIKLFLKAEMKTLSEKVKSLFDLLISQSEAYKNYSLPGYTHLQLGMPSSFGLWFGAYAEALVDDMEYVVAAYNIANKNPLGSGAGYGSTFPLNRQRTTELLGFHTMNYNSVYAQMTRGKSEKSCAIAVGNVAYTLSRIAMDCCLYMNQNFGFITFPDHLTTGSSIMPHKKNPDVFELIRGKCNRLQSLPNEFNLLMANLPSGYHREMQLTKEILFPALVEIHACIDMTMLMLSNIKIKEGILDDKKYELLYTVDTVNNLVVEGMTFRDAYKKVGNDVNSGNYQRPDKTSNTTPHEGSIDRLCNDGIRGLMGEVLGRII